MHLNVNGIFQLSVLLLPHAIEDGEEVGGDTDMVDVEDRDFLG